MAMVAGYAAVAQGAFYWRQVALVSASLVLIAILGGCLTGRGHLAEWVGFGSLGVGLLASAWAARWPEGSRIPAATLLAAAAAFAIAASMSRRGGCDRLLEMLCWVGSGVAVVGVLGLAFHIVPWGMKATGIWRLSSTLTYSNATASLLVMTLPAPLLLWRSRRQQTPRVCAYLILVGLLASVSRGGLLALGVLGLVAAATGARGMLRDALMPFVGACVAVAALVPSVVGRHGHPILALGGLLAGLLIALAPRFGPTRSTLRSMRIVTGIAVVVAAALLSARGGWRLLDSRLNPASEARFSTWEATVEVGLRAPIFGTGPGGFDLPFTRFAHNEYLQTFAETGVVGLASVLLAVWLFARAARRARRDAEPMVWPAAVAACAAFLAHSTLDFLWRFPVLVVVAFTWLALATGRPDQTGAEEG